MNRRVLAVLTMVLAPVCAFAVDGVVLVNQSTVMAVGGFPCTISQPGSYKLAGNLVVDTGKSGIVITTSNVTLDLNGFTISQQNGFTISQQPSSLTGVGVQALNVQSITIRGGTLFGFNISIDLTGTSGVLAEELIIVGTNQMGFAFTNSFFGSGGVIRNLAVVGRGISVTCPMVI